MLKKFREILDEAKAKRPVKTPLSADDQAHVDRLKDAGWYTASDAGKVYTRRKNGSSPAVHASYADAVKKLLIKD